MTHGAHDFEGDAHNARIRVWVNRELVPRDRAVVSVFDASFVAAALDLGVQDLA